MPAGVRSPAALVMPGRFCSRYIRSSKFTRLRLNAVVSAFARMFATTSMAVDNARSPVAAEWSAVIAMGSLSDGKPVWIEPSPRGLPDLADLVDQLAQGLVLVADHVGVGFELALRVHQGGQLGRG